MFVSAMKTETIRPSEAASLLGVSDRTVRRWIASGVLRASRVVSRYRVPRSEVNRLLGQGKPSVATPNVQRHASAA